MEAEKKHAKYTVAVRIRPSLTNKAHSIFTVSSNKYVKELRPKSIVTYSFDQVFEPDHDNRHIYDNSVKEKVNHFLYKSINTTILAYGQTGSGKTHTLFGHLQSNPERERGLAQLILGDIVSQKLGKEDINCSFMQIYKEKVTDLLSGKKINLRDDEKGELKVSEQTIIKVQSLQHIVHTLHKANNNKIFGQSYVHSESSRSHVMLTLTIGKTYLNIVDLCGCQVLTYKFDQKQREQTNSINLSLFTLNTVINDLCDKDQNKFTPFRNSVLTRLLKPSLLNMKKTQIYLFCNIAPEENHRVFSVSTLKFGQIAISIDEAQNIIEEKVNLSQQKRDAKKVSNIIDLNPKPAVKYLPTLKWNIFQEKIFGNKIILYQKEGKENCKANIMFLHAYGYGCSGEDWDNFIPFITQNMDANLFSVDFPGFANSSGKKFTSRAQNFGDKGEALPFMMEIFKIFKFSPSNPVFLVGYDLGGAIALSSAMHNTLKKSIKGVSVFHPTWTDKIQKLALIGLPLQLIWVPVQTFHLVSAGQKMSKVIKNCNLYKLNIGPYTGEKAGGYYDMYADTISSLISEFILNIQPIVETHKRRGKIEQEFIQTDLGKQQQELESNRLAIKQFYGLISKNKYKAVFDAIIKGGQDKPKYVRLASQIPQINLNTTIQNLIKVGYLESNPQSQISKDLPLLPAGRQIHIYAKIQLCSLVSPYKYLSYSKDGEKGITHKCIVMKGQVEEQIIENEKIKVVVDDVDGNRQQIEADLKDVIQLNSETLFRTVNGALIFEDQVNCKYSSLVTKLMLARCCYAIRDIISKLDLSKNTKQTLQYQKMCTKRIYTMGKATVIVYSLILSLITILQSKYFNMGHTMLMSFAWLSKCKGKLPSSQASQEQKSELLDKQKSNKQPRKLQQPSTSRISNQGRTPVQQQSKASNIKKQPEKEGNFISRLFKKKEESQPQPQPQQIKKSQNDIKRERQDQQRYKQWAKLSPEDQIKELTEENDRVNQQLRTLSEKFSQLILERQRQKEDLAARYASKRNFHFRTLRIKSFEIYQQFKEKNDPLYENPNGGLSPFQIYFAIPFKQSIEDNVHLQQQPICQVCKTENLESKALYDYQCGHLICGRCSCQHLLKSATCPKCKFPVK